MRIYKLFVLCLPALLPAAVITDPAQAGGTGTVTAVVSTPSPDNGNPAGVSTNTLSLTETIGAYNGSFDAFAVSVELPESGGRTEYFVTKSITNLTTFTWSAFAVGVGCNPAGMVQCEFFDPLLMDYDVAPTITGSGTMGAVLTANPIMFRFDGLGIAPGDSMQLTFSLGTCDNCQGSWQISQQAFETPEPATLALVGVALLLTGVCRRKRPH